MALTYGFFNAIDGDRKYNAEQFSTLFEGIIQDGIFASIGDQFIVKPSDGMDISVGIGRAWYDNIWVNNDSLYLLAVDNAHLTKSRIDAVVIEIDKVARTAALKIVRGDQVDNDPVNPALAENQHILAYISVNKEITEITGSLINNRIGTPDAPYITGALANVSVETITDSLEDQFNAWFDHIQEVLDESVAGNLQNQINEISNIIIPKTFLTSYQAFVENINSDSLDAAFGKNNQNSLKYIGKQLAQYAWFKGEDPIVKPYAHLNNVDRFEDLSVQAFAEIEQSLFLKNLIISSPYAISFLIDKIIGVQTFTTVGSGNYTVPGNVNGLIIQMIGPGFGIQRGDFTEFFMLPSNMENISYEISLNKTMFKSTNLLKENAKSITISDFNNFFNKFSVVQSGNTGDVGKVSSGGGYGGTGGGGGGAGYGAGGGGGGGASGAAGGAGGVGGVGGIQTLDIYVCGAGGGGGGGYGSSSPGGAGGAGASGVLCAGGVGGVAGAGSTGAAGGGGAGGAGGAGAGGAGGSGGVAGAGGAGAGSTGAAGGGGGGASGAAGGGTPMTGAIIITLLSI